MTRRTIFTCPICNQQFEIRGISTTCPFCLSRFEFTDNGADGYKYRATIEKTQDPWSGGSSSGGGGGGSSGGFPVTSSLPFSTVAVVMMSVIVFFLSNWLVGMINPTIGLVVAIILTVITAIGFALLLYPGMLFGTIITVVVYFVTALIGIMPTISMILCLLTFIISSMIINYMIRG